MKIVSVEPDGRADVYNMEVDGTHSFAVANGVISHNCYDSTRYLLMARPLPINTGFKPRKKPFDPLEDDS